MSLRQVRGDTVKITDINVQLGPLHEPTRYRTADGLLKIMDDYRLSTAVVAHTAAQMTPWIYNGQMSQIAAQSDSRMQACYLLDPMLGEDNVAGTGSLCDRLKASRPAAVRMLPKTQKYPLQAFFCDSVLETLNALRLPLLLDASEIPALADIPPLAQTYPDLPIVILRHYFNHTRSMTPLLVKLPNVYLDVCVQIDTGYLEELVDKRCGSRQLLFGSGLPHHVPAGGLSMILYSTMSDEDKTNILSANWQRLQQEVRYDHT